MVDQENALQELIKTYNFWWFDEYFDEWSPINGNALTQMLTDAFQLHIDNKLSFLSLLEFIDSKADKVLNTFETKDDYEQVYQTLQSFLCKHLKPNDSELIFKIISLFSGNENWNKSQVALALLHLYGKINLEKSLNLLENMLFKTWEDLEDYIYGYGSSDNSYARNLAYHKMYVERREMIIEVIFSLDKDSLVNILDYILDEPPFGWNNNLNRLLGLKYKFLIDKDQNTKEYMDYIIGNLSCCYDDESDLEDETDCNAGKNHLFVLGEELAYKTFFSLITEGYNGGYSYPDDYMKAFEIVIKENPKAIQYFIDNINEIGDENLRNDLLFILKNE